MAAVLSDVFPNNGAPRRDDWRVVGANGVMDGTQSALKGLSNALVEFARLPPNWDSYGAPRISADSINSALMALTDLLSTGVPAPYLVPTPSGGIQAEWHHATKSLELEFVSSVQIEFYFEDEGSGICEEETLSFDLSPLYQRINEF